MKLHVFSLSRFLMVTALTLMALAASSWAINTIDLEITAKDFDLYKKKSDAYQFEKAQLRLNGQQWQVVEELATRGQSSLAAPRRNFGVDLPSALQIGEVRGKKLNLVSMWSDNGYIGTKLGLLTSQHLKIGKGLPTVFAELKMNGSSNGIYLVVQKPKSAADSPYIVRRGYRSRFIYNEAKVDKLSADQVTAITRALTSLYGNLEKYSGIDLLAKLKEHMDLEAYMKLMTLNSLFRNGDGADEVYFYIDSEMHKKGKIYFRIMPWDFDDLFKKMHSSEINNTERVKNPQSIIYNFEDKLDLKFARDPILYGELKKFVNQLLQNELSKVPVDQLISQVLNELMPYLDLEDILNMSRLDGGRKNRPYSKKEVLDIFVKRQIEIDQRRKLLIEITK
ncbi:MAG: CotH kinase family protein [Pseudobdellovibrionaceae bacterium]